MLQEELLSAVEDCLVKFDRKGMQAAVDNALTAGMPPSEVIAGIRKGFEEIGRRYEAWGILPFRTDNGRRDCENSHRDFETAFPKDCQRGIGKGRNRDRRGRLA